MPAPAFTSTFTLARRALTTLALGLALAAGTVLPAQSANAQIAISMNRGSSSPGANPVRTSSVPAYCKVLTLDESQSEAFKTLHKAYKERMQESQKAMNEAFKSAQEHAEDGDFNAMGKKIREVAEKFGAEQSKMTDELLGDLKGLLNPSQADKWPALERLRRRDTMGGGMSMVSGSSIDLIDLVGRAQLPAEETAKVDPVLSEYDLDMDKCLRDREAAMRKAGEEQEKANKANGGEMHFDMESIEKMMKEMRELELKQRDVNTRFLDRILAAVSPEWKAKLETKWRETAFRRIFSEPHALRQLKAAAKFEDLTSEQAAKIEEIKKSYEADSVALNEAWMKAQIEADKEGKGLGGMVINIGGEDNNADDPLSKARKARRDREKRATEDLKALLSEEQRGKLPKRERKPVGPNGEEIDIGDGVEFTSDDGSQRTIIRTNGGGL